MASPPGLTEDAMTSIQGVQTSPAYSAPAVKPPPPPPAVARKSEVQETKQDERQEASAGRQEASELQGGTTGTRFNATA